MNQRRFRNSGQWSTRRWARWTATFVGFPLAGVVARGAVGNIDSLSAAALGGLVGGLTLGTLQATIGGLARGQVADAPANELAAQWASGGVGHDRETPDIGTEFEPSAFAMSFHSGGSGA